MIVKPRYGAGSRAVMEINDLKSWKRFENNAPYDEDFIIETSVPGNEYGVDAMVLNRKFYLVLLRKKIITPPPFRQCVGYSSVVDGEENPIVRMINEYISNIIKVVGLEDGIVHADVLVDRDTPFVIELSARPSGHHLYDLFTPKVTGINMIKEFLTYITTGNCALNDGTERKKIKSYMIHYFDMSDCDIKKIPNIEFLRKKYPIEEYECNLHIGHVSKIVDGHSLMGRGFFILKGENEETMKEISNQVIREFL